MNTTRTFQRAFTLIEMLVAVAIFGIVATLAYGGLSAISNQSLRTNEALERLQEIRRGVIILERDLLQTIPRPVRKSYQNQQEHALRGGALGVMDIEFTRGGWRNPTGLQRSSLQRVAWGFDGETLYRFQWPVLDAPPGTEPQRVAVIEDLEGFAVRFRDIAGGWQEQWPPVDPGLITSLDPLAQLPAAVEFTLDFGDAGRVRRIVEIPDFQGANSENQEEENEDEDDEDGGDK